MEKEFSGHRRRVWLIKLPFHVPVLPRWFEITERNLRVVAEGRFSRTRGKGYKPGTIFKGNVNSRQTLSKLLALSISENDYGCQSKLAFSPGLSRTAREISTLSTLDVRKKSVDFDGASGIREKISNGRLGTEESLLKWERETQIFEVEWETEAKHRNFEILNVLFKFFSNFLGLIRPF